MTEEVEEEPGGEKSREEDERERIGEERDREHGSDDGEVVDAEVVEVFADADGGVGDGFRFGEGGPIEELRPWAAVGEAGADGFGDAGDEGADGGGLGGVGGGDLGIGDWENCGS